MGREALGCSDKTTGLDSLPRIERKCREGTRRDARVLTPDHKTLRLLQLGLLELSRVDKI